MVVKLSDTTSLSRPGLTDQNGNVITVAAIVKADSTRAPIHRQNPDKIKIEQTICSKMTAAAIGAAGNIPARSISDVAISKLTKRVTPW